MATVPETADTDQCHDITVYAELGLGSRCMFGQWHLA